MIRTSEKLESIAKALALFNKSCPIVHCDNTNAFLKNKYASLDAIISTVKPHLSDNGLSVLQFATFDGIVTRILHESGEWIEATTPMIAIGEEKGKSSSQVLGSAITYLRRYSYTAALGIVSDEDIEEVPPVATPPKTETTPPPVSKPENTPLTETAANAVKAVKDILPDIGLGGIKENEEIKANLLRAAFGIDSWNTVQKLPPSILQTQLKNLEKFKGLMLAYIKDSAEADVPFDPAMAYEFIYQIWDKKF